MFAPEVFVSVNLLYKQINMSALQNVALSMQGCMGWDWLELTLEFPERMFNIGATKNWMKLREEGGNIGRDKDERSPI